MNPIFLVGSGGALGAIARYLFSRWITTMVMSSTITLWPVGTFVVNVLGSFFLAAFTSWVVRQSGISTDSQLFFATGFCGAFTTFSTFANESISLLRMGETLTGITYIVLTNFACLFAVLLAIWLTNRSLA